MLRKLSNGTYYETSSHKIYLEMPKTECCDVELLPVKRRSDILTAGKARKIVLVLTGRCNLACSYCYASQGNYGKSDVNRISDDQISRVLNFLEATFPEGVDQVQFFGGEPLLEIRSIAEIIKRAPGMRSLAQTKWSIVTNGTVINNDILAVLKESNMFVTVSLDGDQKTHDFYRTYKANGKGSYATALSNISRFSEYGIRVAVQFTISDSVLKAYEKADFSARAFADEMKARGVLYVHLSPVISPRESEFWLGEKWRESLRNLHRELIEALAFVGILSNVMVTACAFATEKSRNPGYCGAGIDEITIDIGGDIYPCFMFINKREFILGDLNEGIVNKRLAEALRSNVKTNKSSCDSCAVSDLCNMCIGANYIENGDISIPAYTNCNFQSDGYFVAIEQLLGRFTDGKNS